MKSLAETLQRYADEVRISRIAHYKAAQLTMRRHHALGVSIVILATMAGTISMSQAVGYLGTYQSFLVSMLCILCAGLAAVQTFLNYWQRAEMHKFAANQYSALARDLELMYVRYDKELEESDSDTLERLSNIIAQLEELAHTSPSIPSSIWESARELAVK